MKKKKITYGVKGMMEYKTEIPMGRSTLKINFTDGSMTAMGVNPASFTTENFMVQHAIEHSKEFKRGRIYKDSEIVLDEEVHIERPTAPAVAPAPAPQSQTEPKSEEKTEAPIEEETADEAYTEAEAGEDAPTEEQTEEDAPEAETPAVCESVEFSTNDDARDYLEQKFNVKRSKLRTREIIVATGASFGVDIIFTA